MNLTGRPIYAKGQRPQKSKPARTAARDATCTLQIPGVCNGDPATVVGAHLRVFGLAGTAQKPDDLFLVDACHACHAAQEDRSGWAELGLGWDDILFALIRSQQRRREAGIIQFSDGKDTP